jgi:hypothetical protein
MSKCSGSNLSDHLEYDSDDSDDDCSVASYVSEMTNTPGRNRKRTRGPPHIIGKAWVFHGLITTDANLLHNESDYNEEGPFPNLQSLLLAHWTSVLQHLDHKIKKLILHFVFFCSLTSLLSRTPESA